MSAELEAEVARLTDENKRLRHKIVQQMCQISELSPEPEDDWFDGDPGSCCICGTTFQWVRPGKSQATCDCDTICPEHGHGAIQYHDMGEYPQMSGWFCGRCMDDQRNTA